jgi:hypothetical protein
MGTIASARASFGLQANGTPTGTQVAGAVTIGQTLEVPALSGADIAYSFKVTSTGASDEATLDLTTGVVTQTGGTPTITDGDGTDFEGVTLPSAVRIYSVLASTPSTNQGKVTLSGTNSILSGFVAAGGSSLVIADETLLGTQVISFAPLSGEEVTITVIGKSS